MELKLSRKSETLNMKYICWIVLFIFQFSCASKKIETSGIFPEISNKVDSLRIPFLGKWKVVKSVPNPMAIDANAKSDCRFFIISKNNASFCSIIADSVEFEFWNKFDFYLARLMLPPKFGYSILNELNVLETDSLEGYMIYGKIRNLEKSHFGASIFLIKNTNAAILSNQDDFYYRIVKE